MNTHGIFSSMGGVVAIVSILFLPVIGCGGETVTGLKIFQSEQVADSIKIFFDCRSHTSRYHHLSAARNSGNSMQSRRGYLSLHFLLHCTQQSGDD